MINKVTLIGNLGKAPEKRSLPSGAVYVRFSMATNENYKKDGEWHQKTEWHNIIMWREMAERAERMLKKGSLVYIEGKLTHQSWQDENGNMKNMTEVAAQVFRLLEKRENSGGGNYNAPPPVEEPKSKGTSSSSNSDSDPVDTTEAGDNDVLPF